MGVAYTMQKRSSSIDRLLLYAVGVLAVLPTAALATVDVHVTRVGFPTMRSGHVFRGGAWTPIVVDLALSEQSSFDGSIRVGQPDRDGDECYDRVDVHLRAETGGTQRLYLYALADPAHDEGRFVVELFDDQGDALSVRDLATNELTYQVPHEGEMRLIGDDDVLILSLSTAAVGHVQDLTSSSQPVIFTPRVHVGHMSPLDLPELWIGLEIVDYIVWDDARPEELTKRQNAALIKWVQQGGTLLVAASRSSGSVRLSETLYAALPVDLGEVRAVDNVPDVRRLLLGDDSAAGSDWDVLNGWWEEPFDDPIALVDCTLRDGAVPVPNDPDNRSNVITRREFGRGQVIFSAVTLRDLLQGGGDAVGFYRELFHLRAVLDAESAQPEPADLAPFVESAISFAQSGSVYLGVAIIFSAGYVLLATFGTWSALGIRGWRHHSWTAFALMGVAASLLSVVAVNAVRGLGETLHQISIVDIDAGTSRGHATVLFGVKTGTDKRLDFWLPSDRLGAIEPIATDCFLRPLPDGRRMSASAGVYSDPGEYRLMPATAVIGDVRIRATLKQFEGRWTGPLGGTVTGNISVKGIQILDGSYLVNDLGVDLKNCYVLHTVRDVKRDGAPRSSDIYAYPIGDLPADASQVDLVPRCYPVTQQQTLVQAIAESTLAEAQKQWGAEFSSLLRGFGYSTSGDRSVVLGQEKNALLLASTVGEYDPRADAGIAQSFLGVRTWSRSRLRQLDMRSWLRRDTLVLIGFADDPGPVRLFRRTGDRKYTVLKPDPEHSWTMYRIRIPVTLLGEPVEEPDSEEKIR